MQVSKQASLSVTSVPYANAAGEDIRLIRLQNEEISIGIINLGCTITAIYAPDRQGRQKNIVAGFADLLQYKQNDHYFGCLAGRYANRIAKGKLPVEGTDYQLTINDPPHHLHGGFKGFHQKIWNVVSLIQHENEVGVVFDCLSRDGEEGYPGNLRVRVKYVLNDKNQLTMYYRAKTDKTTVVNLTNHSYFNLSGFETPDILDHLLYINAAYYTPKNAGNTPDGHIEKVQGTPFDFLTPKPVGQDIDKLVTDQGYDHNFVLAPHYPGEQLLAAELYEPQSGRRLRVFTDKPGIQVYTANQWRGDITGAQGLPYIKHGGLALETQAFPDSPNQPHFPNTLLHPEDTYLASSTYEFTVK